MPWLCRFLYKLRKTHAHRLKRLRAAKLEFSAKIVAVFGASNSEIPNV